MLSLLPTDTCYGLAGEVTRDDYDEIYRLKGRDFSKPLAFLIRNYEDMRKYIEISDTEIAFLQSYPHPWSFLGKKNSTINMPECIEDYTMLSLRVAESCIDANIRDTIEYPLFLTSANLSGSPESKTLAEAREIFPEIEGIEGGVCDRLPSDVFSLDKKGDIFYIRKSYQ